MIRCRPPSIAKVSKASSSVKENGLSRAELDDDARGKAEARPVAFFYLHRDPNPNAQGAADFN